MCNRLNTYFSAKQKCSLRTAHPNESLSDFLDLNVPANHEDGELSFVTDRESTAITCKMSWL